MTAVLTDIFLMESYVNEKMIGRNADSLTFIKQSFYSAIFKQHKVDSVTFYNTFNYFQSHPKEYNELLNKVDSNMSKIKPLDTTFIKPIVVPPKNIDILPNFNEQEEAMKKEYLKNQPGLQKLKLRNSQTNK